MISSFSLSSVESRSDALADREHHNYDMLCGGVVVVGHVNAFGFFSCCGVDCGDLVFSRALMRISPPLRGPYLAFVSAGFRRDHQRLTSINLPLDLFRDNRWERTRAATKAQGGMNSSLDQASTVRLFPTLGFDSELSQTLHAFNYLHRQWQCHCAQEGRLDESDECVQHFKRFS